MNNRPEIRAVVMDLDGTLLNSRKELPPENKAVMEKAAAKGVMIVPATGRYYSSIYPEIRSLPFMRYYITLNGADFYDAKKGEVIFSSHITTARALEVAEYLETLPVIYDCVVDGLGWMSQEHIDRIPEVIPDDPVLCRLIQNVHEPVKDVREKIRSASSVQKMIFYTADREARAALLDKLPGIFPDLAISSAYECNVEFNTHEGTKARSLDRLCEIGGFGIENILCIGDGLNDVDMVKRAGVGVAMGNGVPEIRAAADYVTGSCDEGGFAAAVRKFCFLD